MDIHQLYMDPISSCDAIILFCRQWIVATAKDHIMQMGHSKHKLLTVKTHAENNKLVLSAKGLPDICVPAEPTYDSKDLIPLK